MVNRASPSSPTHLPQKTKMDFNHFPGASPSSSTSSTSINHHHHPTTNSSTYLHHQNGNTSPHTTTNTNHSHSWWESISKARSRIHILSSLLSSTSSSSSLSSLADSDRPARSLLLSSAAYSSISCSLSSPSSGSGSDSLCHWLYDTFLSADTDLMLVVLSYIPLITSLYLTRIHSTSVGAHAAPSLAGFEAVLLVLYSSEVKARGGKPVLISIPDLSQPSLYHSPRNPNSNKLSSGNPNCSPNSSSQGLVGVLSPPLEPQMAVKSTKRACIVGIALDCYYKQISQMPSWSKLDFCKFVADWAGQDCSCRSDFDDFTVKKPQDFVENSSDEIADVAEEIRNLQIGKWEEDDDLRLKGVRIPLPWELLQPVLRIMGHCLLGPLNTDDVKDAASFAIRCLYARASHELNPQAILATRSLVQLDKRGREAAAAATLAANAASNTNTPNKAKKPEILLVSK